MIYWDMILEGYNDRYDTGYSDLKVFLYDLYQQTQSTHKMEEILGVSNMTILRKLHEFEIAVCPKGKRKARKTEAILSILSTKGLSRRQIVKQVGCSLSLIQCVKRKVKEGRLCII